MSVLSDLQLQLALPVKMDVMGDPVVYTQINAAPRSITAVASRMHSNDQQKSAHLLTEEVLQLLVSNDPVTGMPTPANGDVVTWDGVEWTFSRIMSGDNRTRVVQFVRTIINQSGYNRPPSL